MATHAENARDNFLAGYNCAQALACAFAEEMGMTVDQAARLASGFGGGFGRMREVCGAVSGAVLVYNWLHGYCNPEDPLEKSHHYGRVMRFCLAFQEKWNSMICRELLAGLELKNEGSPVPEARTPEYYKTRPCVRFVGSAAQLLEEMLQDRH